jgi:hypothetical protein
MGRTLATANQIILQEQQSFADFRRTLRLKDQLVFDDLFAGARKHTAAIAMTAHALPFEAILLAMLVEEHASNTLLRQKVDELIGVVENMHGAGARE